MKAKSRIVLPNALMLAEVREMLNEGNDVIILTSGCSMLPFIVGSQDSVTLRKMESLAPGDIVLAMVSPGRYVLHRVIGIKGNQVTLMGDGNLMGTESCTLDDICGTAINIITPWGRKKDCRTSLHMKKARLWRRLLPQRRILLAIYRRTFLKIRNLAYKLNNENQTRL